MTGVEGHKGTEQVNRDDHEAEGVGALLFLLMAVCVSLAVLIGVIVLCQGPKMIAPF